MDPVTLATITSAITIVGTECAKGVASSAGKDLWSRIRSLLHFQKEPEVAELPTSIATALLRDEEAAKKIVQLLQCSSKDEFAASLVSRIDAEKVIVVQNMKIDGDFNM